MILGQVSYLDCIVFLVFLAPQLLLQVGFFRTAACGLRALPFLLLKLPVSFIYERYFTTRQKQSPFCQQAEPFEDLVIRCVKYAFAEIPANIGRVFFSKAVALPWMRWRMLRHGILFPPTHWHEVNEENAKGIWIIADEMEEPDIVIFYIHGGGFSMGSPYFYLEFLLALHHHLLSPSSKPHRQFHNPAIFAPSYPLVPAAHHPTQLHHILQSYHYALSQVNNDSSRICVSGDSAGATLVMSLLLHLGRPKAAEGNQRLAAPHRVQEKSPLSPLIPHLAVLISPWITLLSHLDHDTPSDYLSLSSLHLYARQYAGPDTSPTDPLISPGNCRSLSWWQSANPESGFEILYGAEEVFAPEIEAWIEKLRKWGMVVRVDKEEGGVHAWPVVGLFLRSKSNDRQKGLKRMVAMIRDGMADVNT